MTVKITLKKDFSAQLADPTSQEFKDLATNVEDNMDAALKNLSIPGYGGVKVVAFEAGSVVATVKISFIKGSSPEVKDVVGKVDAAAKSGDLDTLSVDKSISITGHSSNGKLNLF